MSSSWIYTTKLPVSAAFIEYVYSNLVWKDVIKIYKEFHNDPSHPENSTYYLNVSDVYQVKYDTELAVFRTSNHKW